MYIARVLYPVEVLGPGKRVGIWFAGCPRRCKGCSNPELWEFHEQYLTTPEVVYDLVERLSKQYEIDGFTLTGGDPLLQGKDMQKLIALLRKISDDILVYTGYGKEEIDPQYLNGITVLIDGVYVEERNDNSFLRGSSNQCIYILDENLREKYEEYLKEGKNQIQNFFTSDGVISVGIHKPNFSQTRHSDKTVT